MTEHSGDWHRLAEYVFARRNALGLTQDDVRAVGGPSTATQRNIEGAHQASYKQRVISALERALQWDQGSVRLILTGGEPLPIEKPPGRPDSLSRRLDEDSEQRPTVEELAAQLRELQDRFDALQAKVDEGREAG